MQIDLQKILSISGHSGLFMYVSQARNGIIVESLADKKRMCASSTERVSALGDIAIFTNTDDMALKDVLLAMKEKCAGGVAISHKVSPDELKKFFEEILPDYDRERVYPSHIKKVVEWYNLLQKNDMLDFVDNQKETTEQAAE